MSHGKFVTKEEVETIKKWLNKGLKTADVAEITDRSRDTINKVRNGGYDYLLDEDDYTEISFDPKHGDLQEKLDEILDVLNVIAERLGDLIERKTV